MSLRFLAIACLTTFFVTASAIASDLQSLSQLMPPQSVTGEKFALDSSAKCHVLVFLGVECPVARQYAAKLQPLAESFSAKPVQFVGINSNPQDSAAEVAQFQREFKIQFPMLKDSSQAIAKTFKATRTAEAVVIDSAGQVLYQGRVDDQYTPGVARGQAKTHDLSAAIQSVLAGKPIENPRTPPVGCVITFKKDSKENSKTTFTRDVAPLLWKNCYQCHRSGEIGPFDISDYEDLQGWGEMLVEVMEQKRMPPWHADPKHGSFKNQRTLPDGMIDVVRSWIDCGMPFGNASELPEKPTFVDGWRLPKAPDVVFEMRQRPYRVPAEGAVDYQYFVVDPGFTEDKWMAASQIIPGAASVVHHAIVFVRPPDDGEFIGIGWLNAYVPGQQPVVYPDGYARRIPAKSKLVFQMHYTPSGVETFDVSKIGLNFVDADKVTHQIYTTIAIDQDFEIPPNVKDHTVKAEMWPVANDARLLAISPHMHLRGKSFEVVGTKLDDCDDIILKVPHYDFNWQHTYELSQPLPLSELKKVTVSAVFDNSKGNPFNPNPDEYVMWGDQTWEEMALGYFDVAIPMVRNDDANSPGQYQARASGRRGKVSAPITQEWIDAYVKDMLARFDRNGDGEIARKETTGVFRDYGYWAIDSNRDEKITRDELEKAARGRRGI